MKKILLLGKTGQVGSELLHNLSDIGHVYAIDKSEGGDLLNPDALIKIIRAFSPQIIVNAAAYTAVDQAEIDIEVAFTANGHTPGMIAEEAKRLGATFVHYSTDYVFDGSARNPYLETDATNPLNVYGRSKLLGEKAIQDVGGNYCIFRTSWVYSSHGKNFFLTMLKLAQEKSELRIVDDQVGAPTLAHFLAKATKEILMHKNLRESSGLYHLTCAGMTSWKDFAEFIFKFYKEKNPSFAAPKVIGIPSTEYPRPAKRPLYSVLDNTKIQNTFGIQLPAWQDGLKLCMQKI